VPYDEWFESRPGRRLNEAFDREHFSCFERAHNLTERRGRVAWMRILAICGSLQRKSSNLDLLQSISTLASEGVEVVIDDNLRALPLFNLDLEEGEAPSPVSAWRQALSESDAVLVASPEYGHSLPGALKNGIDWVIGSGELHQKIVAITTAVGHLERGGRGLRALRDTLHAIDAKVVWEEPIVLGPDGQRQIRDLLEALVVAAAGD
jgi:chromate reductase